MIVDDPFVQDHLSQGGLAIGARNHEAQPRSGVHLVAETAFQLNTKRYYCAQDFLPPYNTSQAQYNLNGQG